MMPMTFGEQMNSILKNRKMSASAAAQELGFRSKTAFFRILHDECRLSSIENCFDVIRQSETFALTPEEEKQLQTAICVSRFGKRAYGLNRVLQVMISGRQPENKPLDIPLEGSDQCSTLEELLSLLPDDKQIDFLLLGRSSREIIDRLHRLTQEKNVGRITHYFSIDEADLRDFEVFADISSILFSRAYTARFINETEVGQKNWSYHSGMMVITTSSNCGVEHTILLTKVGARLYYLQEDSSGVLQRYVMKMIDYAIDQTQALKNPVPTVPMEPDIGNYVRFTDQYRELETNRAIYSIRPDFPIYCVPPKLLEPVIADEFESVTGHTLTDEEGGALYRVHESRIANLYGKKKPTHIVLSPAAMDEFARTGKRRDHFFLGRPYTPEERVQMLSFLKEQTTDNPGFFIWFLREDDMVIDREVTVYDHFGMAIVKPDTTWQLEKDHQEVLLESRMLADNFKDFFMKILLCEAVMTQEETIALLDRLIETAKEAKE